MNVSSDYASLRAYNSGLINSTSVKNNTETQSSGNYLEQLKGRFSDLNISSGNYTGGTTGTGVRGNVMISPELIEKANNDPKVAAKLESDLGGVADAEQWLKDQCAAKGMNLDACGTIIDENGDMSGWAQTSTSSGTGESKEADDEKDEEDKRLEKKRQEKAAAEKKDEEDALDELNEQALTSYYSEYDGCYDTLLSTSEVPYTLNTYA